MSHLLLSHTAPPVRYPVQRSLWLGIVLALYALLGSLTLLVWGWQGAGTRQHYLQLVFAVVLWLAGCMVAWYFWAKSARGVLVWSGQEWTFEALPHAPAGAGTLAVHLDLQSHLWLRWKSSTGHAHWLWLEQRRARARWSDLRRAVYSRAGTTGAEALHHASQSNHSV